MKKIPDHGKMKGFYLFAILLLVFFLLYSWNTHEAFGGGSTKSSGYYNISWDPPDNTGGSGITYAVTIKDSSGKTVDSVSGIQQTSYEFKDGQWDTKYTVSVTASNQAGMGPPISKSMTSGNGPFPSLVDMDPGVFGAGVPYPTITLGKFVPGFTIDNETGKSKFLLGVKWDPLVQNDKYLDRLGKTVGKGGDTVVSVSGTYTPVSSSNTCPIVFDNPTTASWWYEPGTVTDNPNLNGGLGPIKLAGTCHDKKVTLQAGDQFSVKVTFSNDFGDTSLEKTFTLKASVPGAPKNISITWTM